jgi:uncharacterized protein YuzE
MPHGLRRIRQKSRRPLIWLYKAKPDISEQLAENIIIDLDKKGHIISIEVLDASKNMGKELVTKILNTEKVAAFA